MNVYNLMGFTAKTAAGVTPSAMDDAANGLTSSVYMPNIWTAGSTGNDPRIDTTKVREQANCLPVGVTVMADTEWLVQKMRVNAGGVWAPNPGRLDYQMEFVKFVDTVRATQRGATAKICFFHSCVSAVNPGNGTAWFNGWKASNETMIEPLPGASGGVLGLADFVVGRCYSEYRSLALDAGAHVIVADEQKRLAPNKQSIGLFQPRKSGSDWANEPNPNRFDYLSYEQFKPRLEAVKGKFDHFGLWNSGHYGPQGWTIRNANWYAVASPGSSTIIGDQFTPTDGWWRAMKDVTKPPVVSTMPYGGGGMNTIGPQTR